MKIKFKTFYDLFLKIGVFHPYHSFLSVNAFLDIARDFGLDILITLMYF